jgi:hypothetical protein
MLRMRRKGCWLKAKLIEPPQPQESYDDLEQEDDQEVKGDEWDLYHEVLFGRMSPFCWNSSTRQINDEITKNGDNLKRTSTSTFN